MLKDVLHANQRSLQTLSLLRLTACLVLRAHGTLVHVHIKNTADYQRIVGAICC